MSIELQPMSRDFRGFVLPLNESISTGEEIWAFYLSVGNQILEEFGHRKQKQ